MTKTSVGGRDQDEMNGATSLDEVLHFNISTHLWDKVGNMKMRRSSHAISVVSVKDIINYCI